MGRLRVGLIGVGGIARLHSLGYQDNPQADLSGLCDVDEGLLQQRAKDWGAPKTYPGYRELLADPHADAVEVITPHHLHAPMGIAALEAGKHVSDHLPVEDAPGAKAELRGLLGVRLARGALGSRIVTRPAKANSYHQASVVEMSPGLARLPSRL